MRVRTLLGVVTFASAFTVAATARGDVPGYSDLPSGHASAPPTTKPPAAIGAHERVPGFFLATPSFPKSRMMKMKRPPGMDHVMVVGTAERAKQISENRFSGARDGKGDDVCFSQSRNRFVPPGATSPDTEGDEDADPMAPTIVDWDEGLSQAANVFPKSEHMPNGGVTAVHAERLVRDASGARIEMVDAWVDPVTKGVRKIGSTTLPLRLLATTRGLEVYAARDERDKQKIVQFVVVPPRDVPNAEHESLVAMHQDGQVSSSNGCSHLRVALSADANAAESVTLRATLRLPDRGEPVELAEGEERTARVREAAIQLGVSRAARDKQPVLSVSFGWAGRETTQPVRSPEGD